MGNYLLIGVLIFGLFGGSFITSKVKNIFGSNNKVHMQKSEVEKSEYFRDKVKGIEYRVEERSENKVPVIEKKSLGQALGSFVDKSLRAIVWFFVIGFILLVTTHINIFRWVRKKLEELKIYRKSQIQTSQAIQIAKSKMNGEKKILLDALDTKQDEDVKSFIRRLKDENNIK